jgi:hypothetical protein
MADETYDHKRARRLEEMLAEFARRILELEAQGSGALLKQAGELTKRVGDIRSELFHYEVRVTYDTPEVAESRRIVDEAKRTRDDAWHRTERTADEDDEPRR